GIGVPEIIVPSTGHAAFHKAAHYLGVKIVVTPVDRKTFKADVEAVRAAITENTCLIVASAVSYPHGVIDPVEELAKLAADNGVLCHVDGCMGGFVLPYFRRLGADVPAFDLSVPGVTSISMDLHKFAYAAKGASVVLYNSSELRKHQFFTCAGWAGYTMINATVQSSKSVGPLAAAWAVLNFVGDDGYLEYARGLLDATRRIVAGVRDIPGLRVLGEPDMNLVAFASDEINVFHLIDEMNSRGWYIQPQLGHPDSPPNVHLSIAPANTRWVDELLADLRVCVDKVRGATSGPLVAMAQQALAAIPDPSAIDGSMLKQLLSLAGIEGGGLPERKADINELLNILPPAFKERLLLEFMSDLFTYKQPASSAS
ncbi:MAG: pyridoxal phosphate-dependent decarboxylase family protein, partial [Nannocystaceae bacterium]